MRSPDFKTAIARLLRKSLEHGDRVEIEGLGTFLPGKVRTGGFRFIRQTEPRVFIAYVEEDLESAKRLYSCFEAEGLSPWLDKRKLMPGQNWPRSIETAIGSSDFFVACFSQRSVVKRGHFHSELRFAIECASKVPLDEIFLIPVRLEPCAVPARITKQLQYVDLFPDWEEGVGRVLRTIRAQEEHIKGKELPLAG